MELQEDGLEVIKWMQLYEKAKEKLHPRTISPFIDAGGVSAAILTTNNHVYTGVCIDTSCSLGMCAERNAIANMITNGEHKITRLVCVMEDGRVGMPCGACREMLMQLDNAGGDLQILVDLETEKTIKLKDLMPDWWGDKKKQGK